MNQFFTDFKKRVKNIAFTDSVHAFNPAKVPPVKWAWLAEVNKQLSNANFSAISILLLVVQS